MARLSVLDKPTAPRTSAEDRAAEVLMTAADLFHRDGFDATSMNDIARAVNLTKAGLYYYTKGKDDLLFEIMNFAMDCVDRDIVGPSQNIEEPEDRLRQIVLRHLRVIFATGGAISVLTEEVNKLPAAQRRRIIARKRKYLDLVRETLGELKQAGRLRDLDVTVGALNLFATVLGVARWHRPKGRLSRDRVADETARFVMGGLLKDR